MDGTEIFATVAIVLIGLPWLVLHYLTKWKSGRGISPQDEVLLDDLHEMARRLDGRLNSIERIIAAEDPTWKDNRLTDLSAGDDDHKVSKFQR